MSVTSLLRRAYTPILRAIYHCLARPWGFSHAHPCRAVIEPTNLLQPLSSCWRFAWELWAPCWTSVPSANMAVESLEQRQMLTAAPLATLTILARNDANPDDPYTSSLTVTVGEVVAYQIYINAGVNYGDTYSNASLPITNVTLGSGDGINSLPSFSLLQTAADGVNLSFDNADYDAAASPTQYWWMGAGSGGGDKILRADASGYDLQGVRLVRSTDNKVETTGTFPNRIHTTHLANVLPVADAQPNSQYPDDLLLTGYFTVTAAAANGIAYLNGDMNGLSSDGVTQGATTAGLRLGGNLYTPGVAVSNGTLDPITGDRTLPDGDDPLFVWNPLTLIGPEGSNNGNSSASGGSSSQTNSTGDSGGNTSGTTNTGTSTNGSGTTGSTAGNGAGNTNGTTNLDTSTSNSDETLYGTAGDDQWTIRLDPSDADTIQVFKSDTTTGEPDYAYTRSILTSLTIYGGADTLIASTGNDTVTIDYTYGSPFQDNAFVFNAENGNDSTVFFVDASGAQSFSASLSGNFSLTKTGAGILTLDGDNSYTGGTTISAGMLHTTNPNALGGSTATATVGVDGTLCVDAASGLNLSNLTVNGKVTMTDAVDPGAGITLGTSGTTTSGSLTIGGSGLIDLEDNTLIIHYAQDSAAPSILDGPAEMIKAALNSARNVAPGGVFDGPWTGTAGITSTRAMNDFIVAHEATGSPNTEFYAVGYGDTGKKTLSDGTITNKMLINDAGPNFFDPTGNGGRGAGVGSTVFVKYTRVGDATMDGIVGNNDVTVLGLNFDPTYDPATSPDGPKHWYDGDFNGNGIVDNNDVTILGLQFDPTLATAAGLGVARSITSEVNDLSAALTLTTTDMAVVSWTVYWMDGTNPEYRTAWANEIYVPHQYTHAGTYNPVVVATYNGLDHFAGMVSVEVGVSVPTVTAPTTPVPEGQPYSLSLQGPLGTTMWSVTWAAGDTDNIAGPDATATHTYTATPGDIAITATNDTTTTTSFSITPLIRPTAPTGLTLTYSSSTSATLSWHDNSHIESGYEVLQSTDAGATWQTIATLAPNITSLALTGLDPAEQYVFKVQASSAAAGCSSDTTVNAVGYYAASLDLYGAAPNDLDLGGSLVINSISNTFASAANPDAYVRQFVSGTVEANVPGYESKSYTFPTDTHFSIEIHPNAIGNGNENYAVVILLEDQLVLDPQYTGSPTISFDAEWICRLWEPVVRVSNSAASTYEGDASPTPIEVGLYRHGTGDNNWIATALATTAPALPVDYVLTGSATPGTDYTLTGGTLTGTAIQPGTNGTTVNLSAVVDDLVEGTEPAVFTLAGSGYRRDVNSQSKIVYLSDQAVPGAPGNLTAMLGDGKSKIRLTWTDLSSGETGFHIQRKLHDGDATTWATVKTTAANVTFWQDDLPGDYAGKVYDYRVFSFNAAGDSRAMPVASASGIALQDVRFNGQAIRRDGDTQDVYAPGTKSQWHDANFDGTIAQSGVTAFSNGTLDGGTEWVYPVSFARTRASGNPQVIEPSYINVTPRCFYNGEIGNNWLLKGSTAGYTFAPKKPAVVGGMLSCDFTSQESLPSAIRSTEVDITWELSTDRGNHYFTIGMSNNRMYVTGGTAANAEGAFETVLDIGCTAADGKEIHDDNLQEDMTSVVDHIWSKFNGLNVTRVSGTRLTYYHSYNIGYTSTAELLQFSDGQCGSWASFLLDTLTAQGVGGIDYVLLTPNPATTFGATGLAVNDWTFGNTQRSTDPDFPYVNTYDGTRFNTNNDGYAWLSADVTDGTGIAGQGNANPASLFGNHQMIKITTPSGVKYYDPSYGTKYDNLGQIDATIAGYFYVGSFDGHNACFFWQNTNPSGNHLQEPP